MKRSFDIAIVGAGTAGLTVAALLAQSGQSERMRIVVLDAGPAPHFGASVLVGLQAD